MAPARDRPLEDESDASDEEFVAPSEPQQSSSKPHQGGTDSSGGESEDDEQGISRTRKRGAPEAKIADLEDTEAADVAADAGDVQAYGRGKRRATGSTIISEPKPGSESNAEKEQRVQQADAIWHQIKGADKAGPSALKSTLQPTEPMVRVKRTYRFAGQDVEEEVELPASHPEAVKQAKAKPKPPAPTSSSSPAAAPPPAQAPANAPPPRPTSVPRKRKGGSLASLAAAAKAKPTKINTVEKSKMDWEAFKSRSTAQAVDANATGLSRAEVEEMEAQTHGGARGLGNMQGYLDRADFLDRVHARQEDELSRK